MIVVDNASSDGSAEAVRDQLPRGETNLNSGNDGFAKGNNIGIRASPATISF